MVKVKVKDKKAEEDNVIKDIMDIKDTVIKDIVIQDISMEAKEEVQVKDKKAEEEIVIMDIKDMVNKDIGTKDIVIKDTVKVKGKEAHEKVKDIVIKDISIQDIVKVKGKEAKEEVKVKVKDKKVEGMYARDQRGGGDRVRIADQECDTSFKQYSPS